MKLVGLVEGPEHVCCRYRLAAFRPLLEQAGHRLELRALPRSWWKRLALFRELSSFDFVILQRKLLQRWQLAVLRYYARRLIFDFDDAVFLRDSYSGRSFTSSLRAARFGALMTCVDGVAAGNAFLAEQAIEAGCRGQVNIIPTCVDPRRYPLAKHCLNGSQARLVWIGSASTLPGLERIRDWLEEAGRLLPGLTLKLIADRTASFAPLRTRPCRWSEKTETMELADADIGISWLPDDDWSRGKCGLKVLQYMAAGLPVVANPVGVQNEVIQEGSTGYLVEDKSTWLEAIERLARSPALRAQMGLRGRQRVETHYSVQTGSALWLNLLEQLGAGRKAA